MLKKAKKGMGKSVKNLTNKSVSQISQFTSIVKNTIKTKPIKQSLTATEQSFVIIDGIPDQKNAMRYSDFFDEKLAEKLVNDSKGETSILKASRYLDSGKRLLRNGAKLKKTNDLRGSKEVIRKAHTYAYFGRQLAKQCLLTSREEPLKAVNINNMAAFEDFFLSFLQCDGPCGEDNAVENSNIQVDEALDILSKLSEEEATTVKYLISIEANDIGVNRKENVLGAIADARNFADKNHERREKDTDRDRSLAIHGFVSDLRSFYEIETALKLSHIFLKWNQDNNDDDSGSLENNTNRSLLSGSISYNYSESLKGSYTTAGSPKQEHPSSPSISSRRGRKCKEESLAEGIRPGTTVVSISVKNRHFKNKNKNKNNCTDNKKKPPLPKMWLPVGGRKQK